LIALTELLRLQKSGHWVGCGTGTPKDKDEVCYQVTREANIQNQNKFLKL
jgi:hypothetical protein